jgi:plastocyanin
MNTRASHAIFVISLSSLLIAVSAWGTEYKVAVGLNGDFNFVPKTLTISVGDSVTWNMDNTAVGKHNVVAVDGSFRNGDVSDTPWTYTHQFDSAGSFGYFCSEHRSMGMTGTIIVSAAQAAPTSSLENPQPGSSQSGIGLYSGWSCQGPTITVSIDGAAPLAIPYGGARADTASICGASNTATGFGLLYNFNTLGAGTHSAQLYVNGQAQGSPTSFTVTVPSGEFLTGVSRQVTVSDFPTAGRSAVLVWQQSQQNFAIQSITP